MFKQPSHRGGCLLLEGIMRLNHGFILSVLIVFLFAGFIACGGGGGGGGNGGGGADIIYVSVDDPQALDSNPGTMDLPMASIQAAVVAAAVSYSTANVYVAEGTYNVNSDTSSPPAVQVMNAINLYGGYATDWSVRDPSLYTTTIQDSGISGPGPVPNAAVYADSTVVDQTVLDGFNIASSASTYAAAVYVDGANLAVTNNVLTSIGSYGIRARNFPGTIQNNNISGGSAGTYTIAVRISGSGAVVEGNVLNGGTGSSSTGIWIDATNCLVRGNSINGGSGSGSTSAVLLQSPSAECRISSNTLYGGDGGAQSYGVHSSDVNTVTISSNTINAGAASITKGVDIEPGSAIVTGNSIHGGIGGLGSIALDFGDVSGAEIYNNLINAGGGSGGTIGIRLDGSSADIAHNTISLGTASSGRGIWLVSGIHGSSTVDARNNVIFGDTTDSSFRCFEEDDTSNSVVLSFNDLYCNYLYREGGTPTRCFLSDGASCLDPIGYADNVAVDPVLADPDGADNDLTTMDDNEWQLTMSSPSSVAQGGTDLTADVSDDLDGATRTAPVSMGAYEFD